MTGARALLALALGAPALVPAQGHPYTLDITHTFATFEVLHAGLSTVRGRFDRKEGTLLFDRGAKVGRVEIAIDTASVSTGVAAWDARLRGPEGFDSARHPKATFTGERFVFDGDRVAAVEGTLVLAGRSAPLTLKASNFNCYTNPLFRREVCGGDFEAVLRRSAFGIGGGMPARLADEVRLVVQVEAIRS
jgi:polyisoprenoid-binding protein YceI